MSASMLATRAARWITRCVLALVFLVFVGVYPYIATVNNPNENVRTYMTMALVEHHTFRIDKIVERHGWVNDMAKAPDKKTGEMHLYSVKAPAISYAGVPVYWVFTKIAPRLGHPIPAQTGASHTELAWWLRATTFVLRLVVVQLPCFLFLVWFERFLRNYTSDPVLRLSAVLAAGLGTNYLAYSLMFVSHAPFAASAFVAFGITLRERQRFSDARHRRASRAFLAGLFTGLVTLLEYHALPVSAALALYAFFTFYRPSKLVWLAVGGLLNVGALMFFQWRAFGSPLTPGHKMVENQAFAAVHEKGLFGIGTPSLEVFKDVSLNHGFGFFGMSPFMWLGLLAIPALLWFGRGAPSQRRELVVANVTWSFTMLLLWVTVSGAVAWRGGWTVGPRYLGGAPAFFAFGAVIALEALAATKPLTRTIARGVAGGLTIASVVQIGVLGALYNTLPENITRPLPQFVIPFVRAGFAPYHLGHLFGWDSPRTWQIIVGAFLLATLIAALVPFRDRVVTYVARVCLVGLFAWLGLRPAFSKPAPSEGGDDGVGGRQALIAGWEPAGHDFVTALRTRAEAQKNPCLWYRVADLERVLGQTSEADRDEKRASVPRSGCR